MIREGTDGISHINIYSNGKTELGRWLSNFAYTPIVVPEHGLFHSVEGYWYWLSYEEESLRLPYGIWAKRLGQDFAKTKERIIRDDFQERICKAIDIKIKSDMDKLMDLAESTLPFAHYYVFGGKVKDAGAQYDWIVEHIEMRRSVLQEWLKNKRR